ncbi:MAG: M20/M25/M40 family metallo-hydrolase [Bacteroidales bacterium]|nr:M20/M25/M40 family metallo-hydrolase [Bacteroidales bacterium]
MINLTRIFLFVFLFHCGVLEAQNKDSTLIARIYKEALTSDYAYKNLEYLCKNLSGRLSGSPQAAASVEWTKQIMVQLGADTVYLQQTEVPHWVRGEKETARIVSQIYGTTSVNICALGGSVGTGKVGISGEAVEVTDITQLRDLGEPVIKGKIVFFNRPVDFSFMNTFKSYGSAVDQRISGPAEAAKLGAIGVVVRSVTTALDTIPHTGITRFDNVVTNIPAVAISTLDADRLSEQLKGDPQIRFYFRTTSKWLENEISYNVVGEIKGTDFPEVYLTIGGHLDSWDLGEGAHDDGAGCIQALEVLRLYRALDIKPRHTIRFVMFMDEEIAQSGANTYAQLAENRDEKHFLAIESDRGGFTPFGFSIDASQEVLNEIEKIKEYFEPYGADKFNIGFSGVDIYKLKQRGAITVGLIADSQRYFDYHHSAKDTFDKVNKRELQSGSGAIAGFVYLMDKYTPGFKSR